MYVIVNNVNQQDNSKDGNVVFVNKHLNLNFLYNNNRNNEQNMIISGRFNVS